MKQTVYIASPESQQIHVWRLNEQQETLSLIQEVDVAAQVQPLVISPDGRFLYAGVRPEFRVLAFRIDDDGRLQQAGSAPLTASPTYISLNGDGQFLFSGSYNGACVSVTRLEQGLPVATEQLIEQLDGCHSVNLAPDQRTLWVPALKQDRIYLFTQSDNGQLQPSQPTQLSVTTGAGPRHMAFHPDQPVAYCINELDACVDVWQYQQDQQIHCLQRLDMMHADFNGTRWAADIHITPDGRFLYSSERSASIITVFAVSDNGRQLTMLAHQPTETQPRGFNLDKTGQFLIAVGQKSHHATLYRIDQQTGLLQEKARYATGLGPMWVVVHGC